MLTRAEAGSQTERPDAGQKDKMIYQIVMTCSGLPPEIGPQAAVDIAAGFKARPWHRNVACVWDGAILRLQAENDYDPEGKALGDEFSDEICANTPVLFGFAIKLESSRQLRES